MSEKKWFLLYLDMWPQLSKLRDEELWNVFRNVFRYQNWEEVEHNDRLCELVFEGIRSTLDRDWKTWADERKRRAEAGKLGGLAKASKASNAKENVAMPSKGKKMLANVPVIVSDSVTESVNEKKELNIEESNGAVAPIAWSELTEVQIFSPPQNEKATRSSSPKVTNLLFFTSRLDDILSAFEFTDEAQKEKVREEIAKFRDYWTEFNSAGTKMRWQMEKTFEVKKRLKTWFRNVRGFTSPGFAKPDRVGDTINLF